MKIKSSLFLLLLIAAMAACNYESIDKFTNAEPTLPDTPFEYVFGDEVPDFVKGHPQTEVTDEKAALGRVLFYDRTLSFNNTTACASCHIQSKGFSDGVIGSEGFIQVNTSRNSMTIVNMFSDDLFFWDGRIDNLKEMVLMPIQNHIEMGIDNMEVLVNKVSKRTYYPELFKNAFGSEEVTIDRISDALSSFVGSIGSYQTKFDKVSKGEASYTNLEAEGAKLFFNQFDCDHCHALQNKINSDKNFANIGLNIVDSDPGRQGLFKIPDLRNVAITGPYMHDGRFATLEEVVSHYSSSIQPNKNLDSSFKRPVYGNNFESIRGLDMTEGQKRALIAFLNTLTDIPLITDPKFSDPFEPN